MTIKKFIEKLEKIAKKHGDNIQIKMADGISVVNPVYLDNFINKKAIVITDQKGQPDKLFVVSVEKSNDVHSLKRGDTFVRKGRQNVKIGSTEIMRLKYEKGAIKFENEKSNITILEELDMSLLNLYKKDTSGEGLDDWQ